MKIKELIIEGLFDEYDFHWKLNANTDHDVNILAGRNGSFKSTILDTIYTYIKETASINKFKKISSLCISFTDGYRYTFENSNFVAEHEYLETNYNNLQLKMMNLES